VSRDLYALYSLPTGVISVLFAEKSCRCRRSLDTPFPKPWQAAAGVWASPGLLAVALYLSHRLAGRFAAMRHGLFQRHVRCHQGVAHGGELLLVAPPAADRASVRGFPYLHRAGGRNAGLTLVKVQAGIFPWQSQRGD